MSIPARPLVLLCASALLAPAGCATNESLAETRQAEQRLALERFDRCIDRQLPHLASAGLGARRAGGCDGHRRDVLKTYPAHREAHVARMLDERAAHRSRPGEPAAPVDATTRPLIRKVMELLSED